MSISTQEERKFVAWCKKRGILTAKWTSPGSVGVPDRVVLLPFGRMLAIEFKNTGEELRPMQKYWKDELESLGFPHCVARSKDEAVAFVQWEMSGD